MVILNKGVNIQGLKTQFSNDVHELLEESPYTWYITSGFRSTDEQAKLHLLYLAGKGGKAAPPGLSAHNFGLAVDVVLDDSEKPGLQMLWNVKLAGWIWLKVAVKRHPRLHSGLVFGDWPHIERYQWKLHKNDP